MASLGEIRVTEVDVGMDEDLFWQWQVIVHPCVNTHVRTRTLAHRYGCEYLHAQSDDVHLCTLAHLHLHTQRDDVHMHTLVHARACPHAHVMHKHKNAHYSPNHFTHAALP